MGERKRGWPVVLGAGILILGCLGIFLLLNKSTSDGSDTASDPAAQSCRVGGKPALQVSRLPRVPGVHVKSPVRVLACSESRWHGKLELVGFRTEQAFCFTADSPRFGEGQPGACIPSSVKQSGVCGHKLCAGDLTWSEGRGDGYSQVGGEVPGNVTRVDVRYVKGHGSPARSQSVVAQLRGKGAAAIGVHANYGVFSVVIPGCPPKGGLEVIGRNKVGRTVAIAISRNVFPNVCHTYAGHG
jgi:hypothetical protein